MTKRILILMSDTGGGHRAAAEAIRDAYLLKHPGEAEIAIVDVFTQYCDFPYNKAPDLYPIWINRGKLTWQVGYWFSNHRAQARIMNASLTAQLSKGLRRLFDEHPADLIVNVHPLMATPVYRILARKPHRPKLITVVTDLVSTHVLWYQPKSDRTLVPTQPAFENGLKWGMPADKMRVTGLPVHPRFKSGLISKDEARAKLGWDATLPAILLVGGGSGIGPLFEIASEVDAIDQPCQIIVVAGRNVTLKQRLESRQWNHPKQIYGFMTNMPELMAAADILITKAGPATISEACTAGLPMILSDAIPGQEDGNVRYIVENSAGLYAPRPHAVRTAIADWLSRGPAFLKDRSDDARRIARPDAVYDIVEEIDAMLKSGS